MKQLENLLRMNEKKPTKHTKSFNACFIVEYKLQLQFKVFFRRLTIHIYSVS